MVYSFRNGFLNPLLGRRRCMDICPPSYPGETVPPERAFNPLCPLVEVPPCPEPSPRPIRFLFFLAPRGGLKSLSFIFRPLSFDDLHQMSDFPDHAPDCRGILKSHRSAYSGQTHSPQGPALGFGLTDFAFY